MADTMKMNDDVTVGGQPTEQEITSLATKGFKSVVNLRTAGEKEQPISPDDEAAMVKAAGMQYLHLPVSLKGMSEDLVDSFRAEFAKLPRPVFAHCAAGKRAGAMVMMDMAVEQGMTGDETLSKATEMGFDCDVPELEQFVKQYVDSHQ